MNSPILFIIFNRPHVTARVFERIRAAQPQKLYVAADGPRPGREDDAADCAAARAVIDGVDWPCEVIKLYREHNLGCRRAVSSAITWFFEQEEMGIILEDDCLPAPFFFSFCGECLEKYKDDDRVFHISGSNYHRGWQNDADYSYYFSAFNSIWGWASWRRAWEYYDADMKLWPEIKRKGQYRNFFSGGKDALMLYETFDRAYEGKIDTWDYQWTFAIQAQNGVSLTPKVNLISNIGFGGAATHTTGSSERANLPAGAMELPLKHPPYMVVDRKADRRLLELYPPKGLRWKLKHWLGLIR